MQNKNNLKNFQFGEEPLLPSYVYSPSDNNLGK